MKFKLFTLSAFIFFCLFSVCTVCAQTKPKNKPNSEIAQGKILISKSDCISCHKPTVKLIGPSFQDIAKKYSPTPENYKMLIQKIIDGGSGVWGPMAMSPHTKLPAADAKKMLSYILSIK